jgi:hypothetical protein
MRHLQVHSQFVLIAKAFTGPLVHSLTLDSREHKLNP